MYRQGQSQGSVECIMRQLVFKVIYQNSNCPHSMEIFNTGKSSGTFYQYVNRPIYQMYVSMKFSYPKSILRGSELSAVTGIPENYPLVIRLLQDRFGKKEAIVKSLHSELQISTRQVANSVIPMACL